MKKSNKMDLVQLRCKKMAIAILAAGIAYGIKYYYSQAGSSDLYWIIGPTANLVSLLTQIDFAWEAGAGFLSVKQHAVIAPACGGLNFLIACFSLFFFQGFLRLKKTGALLCWLLISIVAAYFVTVYVNAIRIIILLLIAKLDIFQSLVSPDNIHRSTGVFVYFTMLCILYLTVEKILDSITSKSGSGTFQAAGILPLVCYLLFTILIPLLNRPAIINDIRVQKHFLLVFLMSLVVLSLFYLIRFIYQYTIRRLSETRSYRSDKGKLEKLPQAYS